MYYSFHLLGVDEKGELEVAEKNDTTKKNWYNIYITPFYLEKNNNANDNNKHIACIMQIIQHISATEQSHFVTHLSHKFELFSKYMQCPST